MYKRQAFSSVSVVSNSLLLKRKRIHEGEENKDVEPPTETIMKKEFKVEGMMCNHCRMHVEKALNSMEGIQDVYKRQAAYLRNI